MFNLSVEGEPEYFAEGVLVHNCIADMLLVKAMHIDLPTPKKAVHAAIKPIRDRVEYVEGRQESTPDDEAEEVEY